LHGKARSIPDLIAVAHCRLVLGLGGKGDDDAADIRNAGAVLTVLAAAACRLSSSGE